MNELSEKLYTLITGSSSGLGRALAEDCARRGMNLLLLALPSLELKKAAENLKNKYQVEVDYFGLDLCEKDAPQKIFQWCLKNHYQVNILINNAGMAGTAEFYNSSLEYSDQRILVNIRALTLLTQLFIPEMKKLERAYILNIGSMAGFCGVPYKSVYSASKAFVLELTRALRYELRDSNIKLSIVCPNGIRSNEAAGKRIEAHGLIGRLTELSIEKIARISMDKLLKGNLMTIPGFINKMIYYIGRMLPKKLALKALSKEFKKEFISK